MKLSNLRAVLILMQEARANKTTMAGIKRTLRACKALGIEGQERIEVLGWLDICDTEGNPWNKTLERIW